LKLRGRKLTPNLIWKYMRQI